MVAQRFIVKGRVQGVGFRAFVRQKAQQLNVNGIVKNLHNGSVLVEAEGDESNVNALFGRCSEGPPWSNVSSIDRDSIEPKGYTNFSIAH